ncbi:hypothetical protein [Hyphomicrobium sp. ghe19]|uniref:hypothetical protein n=1 Tax=Hyphomicrobium sp. ghe19 TaxID=2682968 RepID=UPI0013675292|nr:hypothetical protein HYPP_01491 [Hyphomicrobium sp. ghe19]
MTCGVIPIERLPVENDYAVTFEFEEVGIDDHGAEVGLYSGVAHIDQDGAVVGLMLDAYATDKTNPLGRPKQILRYYPVPLRNKQLSSLAEFRARGIADALEKGFPVEGVRGKVDNWHVSIAESGWEQREAAE